MAIDTSIFGGDYDIEYYVEQMMIYESEPLYNLQGQVAKLDDKSDILSDLDSKLSVLQGWLDEFTDPITDYFGTRSSTSSDTDKFTVSADSGAQLGNHSISVERLAASDTRVSKTYANESTDFSSFSSDQTFTITVTHEDTNDSDDDDDYEELLRQDIEVTVTAAELSGTNEEVLQSITDAINNAMSVAMGNELVDNDEVAYASVVEEVDGQSRIILRSGQSGYNYRMEMTDSGDSLLSAMELNAGVQASGSSGGYITYVGTSASDSELNAKLEVDGLTFYRDSNAIDDIFDDVTLELLDTFASTENFSISSDTDSIKNEVQSFMDAYNDVVDFLIDNTQIDTDTYESGMLSDDFTYRGISYELRSILASTVDTVINDDYGKLYDIGIEFDEKGKMKWGSSTDFANAVKANSRYVSDIFNSENGLAYQLTDYLENYIKTGGIIDRSKNNIEDQQTQLNDRISLMEVMLAKKETQLTNEMTTLQQLMLEMQNQSNYISSLYSSY